MSIQTTNNIGARELLPQLPGIFREATRKGQTLSAYLQQKYDSGERDGLDVFGRLMRAADIRTRAIPEAGIWPSQFREFDRDEATRALAAEWMLREYRRVSMRPRGANVRELLLTSDGVPGSWETPYADAQAARWTSMLEPPIPLPEMVAVTTPIVGDAYRAYYLTDSATETRMYRVEPGAEVPRMKLTGGDNTVRLYKYGRAIEATYEQLRNQRLDKISLFIQRMAIRAEMDKVATALDVIENGDGNSNAATVHDLTTLDSAASPGTLTLKGWIAFKLKFTDGYILTTGLMQEAVALQLALLNTGSANVPLSNANLGNIGLGITPINRTSDGVRYGWTSDAPALKIVGFDSRVALERVTQVGATISEVERFTTRQTQTLTMTEIEGYAILDEGAALVLDVNA